MHPCINILRSVLIELSIPFSEIPHFPDAVIVKGKPFVRSTTPFNTESISSFCHDKDAVHKFLAGKILMPRTEGFLDPNGRYPLLAKAKSIEEILIKTSDFLYPRIIKMNRGERGTNVYRTENDSEVAHALRRIFDKESRHYDYIALVQEFVAPKRELRVIVIDTKPVLLYDRKTCEVINLDSFQDLFAAAHIAAQQLGILWGSVDFIESDANTFYFIEANTKPGFDGLISAHKERYLKDLYKIALKKFILET